MTLQVPAIPHKLKKDLWTITVLGLGLRILLLVLPRNFILSYRLPDDAMYYLTIARNLANGSGISFDGVDPTNGFHPLWLFIITPVFWLTDSVWGPVYAILTLQSLIDACCIFAAGWCAFAALSRYDQQTRSYAALSASILVAFNPSQIIRGINGLETSLTALLLLVWTYEYFRRLNAITPSVIRIGVLTGLLFLARTDALIIILPALLYLVWDSRVHITPTKWVLAAALPLLIASPWLVWNIQTFDSIVQTSGEAVALFADAKYDIIYSASERVQFVAMETLRNALKPFIFSSAGIGLITLVIAMRKRSELDNSVATSIMLLVIGSLLLLGFHTVARGFIRDWYVLQMIGIFSVIAAITFAVMGDSRRLVLFLALTLMVGLWITELLKPRLRGQPDWVDVISRPREGQTLIGGFNSGFLGYIAGSKPGVRVVNLDGVVNNVVTRHLREKTLRRYVDSMNVQILEDAQGTIGGYRNLFAPKLTEGFTEKDSIRLPLGEIIEVWKR